MFPSLLKKSTSIGVKPTTITKFYSTATARSFIPPNLVSSTTTASTAAKSASAAANLTSSAADIQPLVQLYRGLPKGIPKSNPATVKHGMFASYRNKHFAPGNESAKPVLHAILIMLVIGYSIQYNFHLKHIKNKEHH